MADLAENTVQANVGLTQALIDEKNRPRIEFAPRNATTEYFSANKADGSAFD